MALRICSWHPLYFKTTMILGPAAPDMKEDTHGMCLACYMVFVFGSESIKDVRTWRRWAGEKFARERKGDNGLEVPLLRRYSLDRAQAGSRASSQEAADYAGDDRTALVAGRVRVVGWRER